MKQRDAFLKSEGDAWFQRNSATADTPCDPEADSLLAEILALSPESMSGTGEAPRILEIGCGDGSRLAWLQENRAFQCFGVEPSEKAVAVAQERGIAAQQGTAEHLPFDDQSMDLVVFGFCLYLCDREDLFRIACEADRVLNNPGWLLILDFYAPVPLKREYHHRAGLFSYKMDYTTLFRWHPGYTLFSHRLCHHSKGGYADDPQEWMATSVLRKNLRHDE